MDGATKSNLNTQLVDDAIDAGQGGGGSGSSNNTRHDSDSKVADSCAICLQPISERAVAVPCNHLTFDFLCLVSWLQERATCPLCKANVVAVEYDWRSPSDRKIYRLPRKELRREGLRVERRSSWRLRASHEDRRSSHNESFPQASVNAALARRRMVYHNHTYSLHVGANSASGHRDFTAKSFTASPELQSRARAFLRRELRVFPFIDNNEYWIEYIIAILKAFELKGPDGKAEELVAESFGRDNARLFLHELQAWLRSPYARLEEWDSEVQYGRTSCQAEKA